MPPGMMKDPATFNRLARLNRHKVGTLAFGANQSSQYIDLPNVGYHKDVLALMSLTATAGGSPTGRFLSGHYGGNTNRFPCPLGIVQRIAYALNVSTPIYSSDGYLNYILNLVNGKGLDPWVQNEEASWGARLGIARKERALHCILNTTDGDIVPPDSTVTASKAYAFRAAFRVPLTFGESAAAGLIPVQDIRIHPQLLFDFGNKAHISSAAADFAADPTGNLEVICDYFTVPDPGVRPDTDYVLQTTMDQQTISGVGELVYRPQIGGIITRIINTFWNSSKAVDPFDFLDTMRLRIQQGVVLEHRPIPSFLADECRFYGKRLPDEVLVWDHTTGLGDPTLPSLRDRISSNQLTSLEYIADIDSGQTITATAENRILKQQLIPLPRGA